VAKKSGNWVWKTSSLIPAAARALTMSRSEMSESAGDARKRSRLHRATRRVQDSNFALDGSMSSIGFEGMLISADEHASFMSAAISPSSCQISWFEGLTKSAATMGMSFCWLLSRCSAPFSTEFSYSKSRRTIISSLHSAALLALSLIFSHSNSAADSRLESEKMWCFCSVFCSITLCICSSFAASSCSRALIAAPLAVRGDEHVGRGAWHTPASGGGAGSRLTSANRGLALALASGGLCPLLPSQSRLPARNT